MRFYCSSICHSEGLVAIGKCRQIEKLRDVTQTLHCFNKEDESVSTSLTKEWISQHPSFLFFSSHPQALFPCSTAFCFLVFSSQRLLMCQYMQIICNCSEMSARGAQVFHVNRTYRATGASTLSDYLILRRQRTAREFQPEKKKKSVSHCSCWT